MAEAQERVDWKETARAERVFGSPVAPFLDEVERQVREARRVQVDRFTVTAIAGYAVTHVGIALNPVSAVFTAPVYIAKLAEAAKSEGGHQ